MKNNVLKNWYKICNPNKKFFKLSLSFQLLISVLSFLQPIAFANVVNHITLQNFTLAVLWVLINLCLLIGIICLSSYEYSNYSKLYHQSFVTLQNVIVTSTLNSKRQQQNFSNEFLGKVADEDVDKLVNFSDTFCLFCGNALKIILIVTFVCFYSFETALFLFSLALFNFFILKSFNNKRMTTRRNLYNSRLLLTEKYSDILKNKNLIYNLDIEAPMIMEYEYRAAEYTKNLDANISENSIKDNWFLLFWNIVISVSIFILIYKLSQNEITLTLFLIIVPYVSSFILKVNDISVFLNEYSKLKIAQNRFEKNFLCTDSATTKIENVHNFKIYQGNKKLLDSNSNRIFLFKNTEHNNNLLESLLLKRSFKSNYRFLINDKKHTDIQNYITIPTTSLSLFDDTLLKNLMLGIGSKNKVIRYLKELQIYEEIKSLSSGISTNINRTNEELTPYSVFIIQFLLKYFSKKQIFILKDLPYRNNGYSIMGKFIESHNKNKIVLIFESYQSIYIKNAKIFE